MLLAYSKKQGQGGHRAAAAFATAAPTETVRARSTSLLARQKSQVTVTVTVTFWFEARSPSTDAAKKNPTDRRSLAKLEWWLRETRVRRSAMRTTSSGFIFSNQGPSLNVHRGQCLTSMSKHDAGGSWNPPRIERIGRIGAFYAFYALGVLFSVIGGPCTERS